MEQPKTATASPSFAGLLVSLAAPAGSSRPDWNEDGLADDIAELSYESALLRPASSSPQSCEEKISITEAGPPADEGRMRSQRITLRLSNSDALQLRARAAESGLTVSAYLRTCILEVEGLRAQVKDALARMRSPETQAEPDAGHPPARFGPQPAHRWRERLFPRRGSGERAECA